MAIAGWAADTSTPAAPGASSIDVRRGKRVEAAVWASGVRQDGNVAALCHAWATSYVAMQQYQQSALGGDSSPVGAMIELDAALRDQVSIDRAAYIKVLRPNPSNLPE